ncbi:MAG: pilus motility taxis protein HmpF [Cyanobacteriota bacterium]|nr:pilus motility taxis protein HmpF [Cyanobacteriota bacterium]
MLYLAELSKPTLGRPTLLLLAKQVQENVWQGVNEEPAAVDSQLIQRLKDGQMVLADIASNRQITRINEAGKQLVTYLQNFTRLQDKARTQEEEIETWKSSLTFQSQELNRREMELEAQEEELQRLFEKYQSVQEESKILEAKREEIAALEAHIADQQRLIGQQRESLNQQQQELQARLDEAQQSRLSEAEAQQLEGLISQLQAGWRSGGDVGGYVQPVQQQLQQRRQELDHAFDQLNEERNRTQQQQQEADRALQAWLGRRQEWLKARLTLDQALAEVRNQEALRRVRQEQIQKLTEQIQLQEDINRYAYGLVRDYDFITANSGVGSSTKPQEEAISPEELTKVVQNLRRQYDQRSAQVNQQMAELEQNRQSLYELQERLTTASPDERMEIEMDIDYAQSACVALEETLFPQQESLQREYEELVRQEARLAQLKGGTAVAVAAMPTVDIGPMLAQLNEQKQSHIDEKERLETQLQQLSDALRTQQETLTLQQEEMEQRWRQLEGEEGSLRGQLQGIAETWGRLQQRQDLLQQERDRLSGWQQQIDHLSEVLSQKAQAEQTSQEQLNQIQTILQALQSPA